MNIKKIIQEEVNDFEWMEMDLPMVTTGNAFLGMSVKLNPESQYSNQSDVHGTIVQVDDEEMTWYTPITDVVYSTGDAHHWVEVQWDGGDLNSYRVGPTEFDLLHV
jgi:hypothetical protein